MMKNINLVIGEELSFQRSFSSGDIEMFAKLTGDLNPIHLSEDFARNTDFKQRIIPGILIMSLFSKIFGTMISDCLCIWKFQSFKFIKPVFLDEEIKAVVRLNSYDVGKSIGSFDTLCFKNNHELILTGEAQIKFK